MRYKYLLIYPDGETEASEDSYATEYLARLYAEDDCAAYAAGADVLDLMGEESDHRSCRYRIYTVND